jgi:hypothetical protein
MNRCSALTIKGSQCKQGRANCLDTCWIHSDSCSICLSKLGTIDEVATIKCGHKFHAGCIENWRKIGKFNCPMCREGVFSTDIVTVIIPRKFSTNLILSTYIQDILDSCTLYTDKMKVMCDGNGSLVLSDYYTGSVLGDVKVF